MVKNRNNKIDTHIHTNTSRIIYSSRFNHCICVSTFFHAIVAFSYPIDSVLSSTLNLSHRRKALLQKNKICNLVYTVCTYSTHRHYGEYINQLGYRIFQSTFNMHIQFQFPVMLRFFIPFYYIRRR